MTMCWTSEQIFDRLNVLGIVAPTFGASCTLGPFNSGPFLFNPSGEASVNVFLLPEFKADLDELPANVRTELKELCATAVAFRDGRGFERLAGQRLESRPGTECLEGYLKIYLCGAKYRVVFQQSGNTVAFIAAGARADMAVYKKAADRVRSLRAA